MTVLASNEDLFVLRTMRETISGGAIVAFDLDVYLSLLDAGADPLTPWEVVDRSEWSALRQFEQAVWGFWNDHARAVYEGVDLLRLARYRHMACMTRLSWAAYFLQRALVVLRPKEVIVFDERRGHGLDPPPGSRRMPLLSGLLRGMAEQAGVRVRLVSPVRGASPIDDSRCHSPAAFSPPPVEPSRALGGRPFVLFPGSGVDLPRQLPLIRAVRERTEFVPVQLYKSADLQTVEELRRLGHPVWHESQVAGDIAMPRIASLADDARRRFNQACAAAPAPLRAIFANCYMDPHYDFIFGEYLTRMAWQVRAWRTLFQRHRPACLVANYPAPICDVAHEMGIPCLGLTHGLMMLGDTRWFQTLPPSMIGAIGEPHRRRLLEAGMPSERVCVVGDPGSDELILGESARQRGLATAEAVPSSGNGLLHALRRAGRRIILLATGNLAAPANTSYLPMVDFGDAVRCFEQIAAVAERRPDWAFILRPHPRYDHPSLYRRVNRGLPDDRKLILLPDGPAESILPWVDAVVFPNARSSALIEFSLWGKPVYLLDAGMIWFDQEAWGVDQWPHVHSVREMEAELELVFSRPDEYQRRVKETRQAMEGFWGGPPQPAAARCVEVIRSLVEGAARRPRSMPALTENGGVA